MELLEGRASSRPRIAVLLDSGETTLAPPHSIFARLREDAVPPVFH